MKRHTAKGEVIPTFSWLVEIKLWLVGFQFAPATLASKQNEIGQTSLSVPVDIQCSHWALVSFDINGP